MAGISLKRTPKQMQKKKKTQKNQPQPLAAFPVLSPPKGIVSPLPDQTAE